MVISMIEVKPIIKLQKDYLELLKMNYQVFSNSDVTHGEMAYFFEEVSIFWRRNYEIINFFFEKIDYKDKVSFLAGAIYIDLESLGHYEFAPCGKYRILSDPVTKMKGFFSGKSASINEEKVKEHLKKVLDDCMDVLASYSEFFIVLPLDAIFLRDEEERKKILKDSSFSFISDLFLDSCQSEEEFIEKYHSIAEIEKGIKPEFINLLIFNSKNDVNISLQERIEDSFNGILSISSLRDQLSETQIFLMAVGQFFMQILDVILIAFSYKLIPFIRSDVVFNYLLMVYPNFLDNYEVKKILEQAFVAHIFSKLYRGYDFSNINFNEFYNHVSENKIIDLVIEKSRSKGNSIFDLKSSDIAFMLKEECKCFLPKQ